MYVSTMIRCNRLENHPPDDRLEAILCFRPPQGDCRLLDALYVFAFEGVERHGQLVKTCLVVGILYLLPSEWKRWLVQQC